MKSWTEVVWDWLAIARTDRKSNNNTGLKNWASIETFEKHKWVCLEWDKNWFGNNKDAEMGPKIWFVLKRVRVVERSIESCHIYIDRYRSSQNFVGVLFYICFVKLLITRGGLLLCTRVVQIDQILVFWSWAKRTARMSSESTSWYPRTVWTVWMPT